MKTLITTSVVSLALLSQVQADCYPTKSFIQAAAQNYGEFPVWSSTSDGGQTVTMFMNPETQTWGIVQGDDETVCLLGSGVGIVPVVLGDPA